MLRTISSAQTLLTKFVFPVIWITGFGVGTILTLTSPRATDEPVLLFPAIWIVGAAFIWITCRPLKKVQMDGEGLVVSNYLREIRVPRRAISGVRENRWLNHHPVTITLREDLGFGRQITFMPTVRMFAFWSSHPIVAELQSLAGLPHK
jgi:hypothetical protein